MRRKALATAMVFAGGVAAAHSAEVYRWVDEKGVVQYGDRVPDDKKKSAKQVEIRKNEPSASDREAAEARRSRERAALQAGSKPEAANTGTASLPGKAAPAAAPSCQEQWAQFEQSNACFGPYRLANGGIKAEAFKVCKEVRQPACPNPTQPSTERH